MATLESGCKLNPLFTAEDGGTIGPHDFVAFPAALGPEERVGYPSIFCRACGEVRLLRLPDSVALSVLTA